MSQSKRICFWVPLVHGRCRCGNCYQTRWCWSSKLQQFANSKPWPIEWSLSHSEAISDMIFSSYSHDVPMIFQKFSVILGLQLIDIPMIDMSILGFHTSDTGWWFTYPSEKYEFVSWDDEIPIWKVIKFMFTTNQNSIITDIPSGKSPMFNRKTNYFDWAIFYVANC